MNDFALSLMALILTILVIFGLIYGSYTTVRDAKNAGRLIAKYKYDQPIKGTVQMTLTLELYKVTELTPEEGKPILIFSEERGLNPGEYKDGRFVMYMFGTTTGMWFPSDVTSWTYIPFGKK